MSYLISLVIAASLMAGEGERPASRIPPAFPDGFSRGGEPAPVTPRAVPPGGGRSYPEMRKYEAPAEKPGSADWLLRRMAGSANPEYGARAAEAWPVSEDQAEALRALFPKLSDPAPLVRAGALQRVSDMDSAVVFGYVMQTLASGALDGVKAVDAALPFLQELLGAYVVETLRLELETPLHRRIAAYCLGRMGALESAEVLAEYLWGEDAELARACLDALAHLLPPGSTEQWLRLLEHEAPYFRNRAVYALTALNNPKSNEMLRSIVLGYRYPELQSETLRAVSYHPNDILIPLLIEIMEQNRGLRAAALRLLRARTDLDLGPHPAAWREWLNAMMFPTPPPLVPGE